MYDGKVVEVIPSIISTTVVYPLLFYTQPSGERTAVLTRLAVECNPFIFISRDHCLVYARLIFTLVRQIR